MTVMWVLLPVQDAWAACAPPTIVLEPARGAPGQSFVVRGSDFGTTCDDVATPDDPETGLGPPDTDIPIRFIQGGAASLLATASADNGYDFRVAVDVPADARPGAATVVAEGDNGSAEAQFEVAEPAGERELPHTGLDPHPLLLAVVATLLGGKALRKYG